MVDPHLSRRCGASIATPGVLQMFYVLPCKAAAALRDVGDSKGEARVESRFRRKKAVTAHDPPFGGDLSRFQSVSTDLGEQPHPFGRGDDWLWTSTLHNPFCYLLFGILLGEGSDFLRPFVTWSRRTMEEPLYKAD